MANVNWGKPAVYYKDLDETTPTWYKMPDIVEDTTELQTTKGDKVEAKIEGGENEDVRFKRNTYALTLAIRDFKGRTQPISHSDGLVTHNYAIAVVPEDATCVGIYIPKSQVSVEDTYTAADGSRNIYTFDALKPTSGTQVQKGTIVATEGTGTAAGTYTLTLDNTAI